MKLRDYRESRGLDRAAMAEELSALLGKKIGQRGIALKDNQEIPKTWAVALQLDGGVSTTPSGTVKPGEPITFEFKEEPRPEFEEKDGRETEQPPTAPTGAKIQEPISIYAADRISKAYSLVGFGLSKGLGNDGIAVVIDDFSPHVAKAWIEAAKENEFAARFVAFMTAGGAMGEVVTLHLAMLGGILYVKGVFPDVGLYSKYQSHREAGNIPEFSGNGAADGSAENVVGEPTGAATK